MNKYAKIIPLKKFPQGINFFDYKIPNELIGEIKIGQIVEIPFKKSQIKGLVYELSDKSNFKWLKYITNIDNSMFLKKEYIDFLTWFSENYYYSMGGILKLLLPPFIQKKHTTNLPTGEKYIKNKVEQKDKNIEQFICSVENKFFLFNDNYLEEQKFLNSLCSEIVSQNKQILILFPNKNTLNEFASQLSNSSLTSSLIITADIHNSKNLHLDVWQAVKNKDYNIVLGTRSAIFLPFENYDYLYACDYVNEDYNSYDQDPRYNAIEVLKKIQELKNNKIILASPTPKIEDFYFAKENNYKIIKLKNKNKPNLNLINLDFKHQLIPYLNHQVFEELKNNLKQNQKSLLIINKLGLFSQLSCSDCDFIAKCPTCKMPLMISHETTLTCKNCHKTIDMPLVCPKCQGHNLKRIGIGIENFKINLEKHFSNQVYFVNEVEDFSKPGIYLSTGINIPTAVFTNLKLLSFIYFDGLFYLPDFKSSFKVYNYLLEIINKANSINPKINISIQSKFLDNLVLKNLDNYLNFYKEELKQRKKFNYPPYSRIIKLIYEHEDKQFAKNEANTIYSKLSQNNDIIVSSPYAYYAKQVRGRFRYQIAIFVPNSLKLDKENQILAILDKDWIIDKNPINLL